jgi:hypothetical protein
MCHELTFYAGRFQRINHPLGRQMRGENKQQMVEHRRPAQDHELPNGINGIYDLS